MHRPWVWKMVRLDNSFCGHQVALQLQYSLVAIGGDFWRVGRGNVQCLGQFYVLKVSELRGSISMLGWLLLFSEPNRGSSLKECAYISDIRAI